MITTAADWIFDTMTKYALLAITLMFMINYIYDLVAYSMALQAYSIVNPFGPDITICGISINPFEDTARTAAHEILAVFYPKPAGW
ncbi:hypothetical protein [uncultured Methanomethylovorans sp.]|jgi:hypothetical protein|uniref:hypothetical protein n=1 Tax=uncultured Methanomethylovorans sp. TaxID=183759 RepID=UPI002AA83AD9|nr:hypothetical protein [uncultured Methanomethylovorans sp.]